MTRLRAAAETRYASFPSLSLPRSQRLSERKTLKSLKTFNIFKVFPSHCKDLRVFQTPGDTVGVRDLAPHKVPRLFAPSPRVALLQFNLSAQNVPQEGQNGESCTDRGGNTSS